MFPFKTVVKLNLLSANVCNRCLRLSFLRYKGNFCKRVNTIHKRSTMLTDMVMDRDKRKTWHFEILQNHAKAKNVFENISRPSRRQGVLNSIFIQNISDVLSTGDIAPEILECGIELTGVKVSPCCQMVNVYWQIPPSRNSSDEDIAMILNKNASKVRAEIISRNVMGRVPRIFFVRDSTNAYIAAFEKAMVEIDLGPERSIIPDQSFVENIYDFKDAKEDKVKKVLEIPVETPKYNAQPNDNSLQRPLDMKTNLFGLDQEKLMSKVLAMKAKEKFTPSKNILISSIGDASGDLFSQIPGTTFCEDTNREELLKKFHIERKKLRNKKTPLEKEDDIVFADSFSEEPEIESFSNDDDCIEEDTAERF